MYNIGDVVVIRDKPQTWFASKDSGQRAVITEVSYNDLSKEPDYSLCFANGKKSSWYSNGDLHLVRPVNYGDDNYWISVKDRKPKGWCNVMLCHYDMAYAAGKDCKIYGEISFGIGLYTHSPNLDYWSVPNYDTIKEWDVIAFHEIEHENLDAFIKKMQGVK